MLSHALTGQRTSLRLLISIISICILDSLPQFFTRDVSKVHVHFNTIVQRKVFVGPPANFFFSLTTFLRVDPLYGLPQADFHWFHNYMQHRKTSLTLTVFKDSFMCPLQSPQNFRRSQHIENCSRFYLFARRPYRKFWKPSFHIEQF